MENFVPPKVTKTCRLYYLVRSKSRSFLKKIKSWVVMQSVVLALPRPFRVRAMASSEESVSAVADLFPAMSISEKKKPGEAIYKPMVANRPTRTPHSG